MEQVMAEYEMDSDSIATEAMDFLQARVSATVKVGSTERRVFLQCFYQFMMKLMFLKSFQSFTV